MFLAVIGIPGVGKTSLCKELLSTTNSQFFGEPERTDWPEFIDLYYEENAFEVLMWFRVFQFAAVQKCKNESNSGLTITDAYYHKFLHDYIDAPNSNWIIPRHDPYFAAFKKTVLADQFAMPDADAVVTLKATKSTWLKLVQSRQGTRDDTLIKHAFSSQEDLAMAARKYCNKKSIPLLEVDQKFNDIDSAVSKVSIFIDRVQNGARSKDYR